MKGLLSRGRCPNIRPALSASLAFFTLADCTPDPLIVSRAFRPVAVSTTVALCFSGFTPNVEFSGPATTPPERSNESSRGGVRWNVC